MEARRETETTEVFSMVLGFILAKTLCPQRHCKVCFELLETFWITPKRTCLSVICSSVVGQLRRKEHIKKHKKFLIFLINVLDFIFLCKIRNNDRTISMTVLCCLNFSDKELFAFKRLVYFSSIIFP